jgi:serine/threonine protein kinase
MVLQVINPINKKLIVFNEKNPEFMNLYEKGYISNADVIIQNIKLPFKLTDKYTLKKLIGRANSPVYQLNYPDLAAKLCIGINCDPLLKEKRIANEIGYTGIVIPKYYDSGKINFKGEKIYYIILDKLKPLPKKFSNKEFKKLTLNMLYILYILGTKNLTYSDFKPQNILYNTKTKRYNLIDLESIQKIGLYDNALITANYAPTKILNQEKFILSQYSDLENIVYTLYVLYHGDLPWFNENIDSIKQKRKSFLRGKQTNKVDQLLQWMYQTALYKQDLFEKTNDYNEIIDYESLEKIINNFL